MSAAATETASLVTWDAPENRGKVPGSDWICPTSEVTMLSLYEMLGGEVNDTAVRRYANGRPQHLELLEYPEGYHALQVIDSESGAVLNDQHATKEYADYTSYLEDCNLLFGHHPKPGTRPLVDPDMNRFIDLGDGRRITSLTIYSGSSHIAVYPRPVTEAEADADNYMSGSMSLHPEAKNLIASHYGRAGTFDGRVRVEVSELNDYGISGAVILMAGSPRLHNETVVARFDGQGQVTAVEGSYGAKKFLRGLGADPAKLDWTKTGRGTVTDLEEQRRAAGGIGEILGLGNSWEGIDVRLTAAGLYAALGQYRPDLNQIIVPRSTE